MKRFFIRGICSIIIGMAVNGKVNAAAHMDGSHLHQVTGEYVSPHLDWGFGDGAKAGRPRALFMVPRLSAREVVELTQRMPLDCETLVFRNSRALGSDDIYEAMADGTSVHAKEQELAELLKADYALYILGNVSFLALPPATQYHILSKVRDNGASLIVIYNASGKRLPYSKLYDSPIGNETFLDGFNTSEITPAAWQVGKGVFMHLPYDGRPGMAFTPVIPFGRTWQANYETSMALLMRTLLWSVPEDQFSGVHFSCPELAAAPELTIEGAEFDLALPSSGLDTIYRIRNSYNDIVLEGKGSRIEIPRLSAGNYFCDVMLRRDGETVNVGVYRFSVASPCGEVVISAPEVVYERDSFSFDLSIEKPLPEDASITIRLLDSPAHLTWYKQELTLEAGTGEAKFLIENYLMPTIAGHLVCEVHDAAGNMLVQADKAIYFPDQTLPAYPNIGWEAIGEGMGPLLASQITGTMGWNIGLTHPPVDLGYIRAGTLLNQRLVLYTTRICLNKGPNAEAKQYRWFTQDKEEREMALALGDDNCFYRPEVRETWRRDILHRINNVKRYSPVIYSLGDENSLNVEGGFGPHDEFYFRKFLERRFAGEITALNAAWNTEFRTFDEIPHLTLEEAHAASNYPAWFAHRQYMEQMYADIHHFCREIIREQDPQAIVGAEGSVPGEMELTMGGLDFWGPYNSFVEDEVLRSLGADKLRSHWWGGLTRGNTVLFPQQLSYVLKGSANGSAWYTTTVSAVHAGLGVDGSLPIYVKGYLPAMDLLRFGVAQLLSGTPLVDSGVRFFWSHASKSAKMLDPRFAAPVDGLATLIEATYNTGVNFEFVSERTLSRLVDPSSRILFLCGANAISDDAATAIRRFAQRGGVVVADLAPGLLNEHLGIRPKNALADLFGEINFAELPAPELLPLEVEKFFNGEQLKFKASKAQMTPGVDLFQIRRVGLGSAILLNFGWSVAANTADSKTPVNEFFLSLLKSAGALPDWQVEAGVPDNTMVRVRRGRDFDLYGVRITDRAFTDKGTCSLKIGQKSHLYRPSGGKSDRSDRIRFDFSAMPFDLVAAFDTAQSPPAVTIPDNVTAGGTLNLDLSAIPAGRTIRIWIEGPDGKPLLDRHQVVERDSRAHCNLPFSFDDPAGLYSLTVTDLVTGLSTSERVHLK